MKNTKQRFIACEVPEPVFRLLGHLRQNQPTSELLRAGLKAALAKMEYQAVEIDHTPDAIGAYINAMDKTNSAEADFLRAFIGTHKI